jgi:hypothetical protein
MYIVHDMNTNEATQYDDFTSAINDIQAEYANYYADRYNEFPDLHLFKVERIEYEVIPTIVT